MPGGTPAGHHRTQRSFFFLPPLVKLLRSVRTVTNQNDTSTPMVGSTGNMLIPLRVGGLTS